MKVSRNVFTFLMPSKVKPHQINRSNEFLEICMTRSNGEYCVPQAKELFCNEVGK